MESRNGENMNKTIYFPDTKEAKETLEKIDSHCVKDKIGFGSLIIKIFNEWEELQKNETDEAKMTLEKFGENNNMCYWRFSNNGTYLQSVVYEHKEAALQALVSNCVKWTAINYKTQGREEIKNG